MFILDTYSENQKILLESVAEELGFKLFVPNLPEHPKYGPSKMVIHDLDGHPTPLANQIKAEIIAD